MKYFFLLIPLLWNCSIYQDYRTIIINGCSNGSIVLSSSSEYMEFNNINETIKINLKKGECYYLSYYPQFNNLISRFCYGAIIDFYQTNISVDPYLGPLTKGCNELNRRNIRVDKELLDRAIINLSQCSDPWVYNSGDILLYLNNQITFGSVEKYRTFEIENLNYLRGWLAENSLFDKWYESIQYFYNSETKNFYRLEIFQNGDYIGF